MVDVEAINRLLHETVPFGRAVGARVVELGPARSVAVLPDSPDTLNHVGTVHAVAQFGVGEVAAGTLILAAFSDLRAAGYAPVIADVTIHYRKAARGELRATATLADVEAEQARVRSQVAAGDKARLSIPVRIATADGTITTELETTWVLLAPRS
ncbi:MAG TPA: YiiD C-terminal domain-containing protein [Ktedonobacterales bacterium]|nr:YiiD C-terminal domain-containing protein [Ktedonobacterales bacterium]